jgi:hypothetical protein
VTRVEIHRLAEVSHQVNGLTPVLWLVWLTVRKHRPGAELWWLSGAFTTAWVADTVSHWTGVEFVAVLYPVAQGIFVGLVLLDRWESLTLTAMLGFVGIAALFWRGIDPFNPLLPVVAWGAITGIAWRYEALGRLRLCLLVTFGLGLLAWIGYLWEPGLDSWGIYQFTRFAGAILFCWAASNPLPHLKLTRA